MLVNATREMSLQALSFRVSSGSLPTGTPVSGPSGLRKLLLQWMVRDGSDSQIHLVQFLTPSLDTLVELDVSGCDSDTFLDFRNHQRSVYPAMRSFRSKTNSRDIGALGAYAEMFPNLTCLDLGFMSVSPDYVQWTVSRFPPMPT